MKKSISNSLDINVIHGHIHGRSCKKCAETTKHVFVKKTMFHNFLSLQKKHNTSHFVQKMPTGLKINYVLPAEVQSLDRHMKYDITYDVIS